MLLELIRSLQVLGEPLGLLWLANLGAAAFLFWRRKPLGGVLLAALAALYSLVGGTPLAKHLLASLERPYVSQKLSEVAPGDVVVMLGGAARPSRHDAFGFEFRNEGDRLLTALELMRQGKGKVLVLGGGMYPVEGTRQNSALLLQSVIKAWDLTQAPVICLENCNDTHAEAMRVIALAKEHRWQRILLVTSAYHLGRAIAIFQKAGVPVAGIACDFRAVGVPPEERTLPLVPRERNFVLLTLYLHEQVGWLVYWAHGWVD